MALASNNDAVRKSIRSIDSSFASFRDVHMQAVMELKERRAVRFCISNSQTRDAELDSYFTSPSFTVAGIRWYFHYYPRGQQVDGDESIKLYLRTHEPSNAVVGIYTCTLVDQSLKPVVIREFGVCNFSRDEGFGWHDLATRADIERICAGNDDLRIDCDLAVYKLRDNDEMVRRNRTGLLDKLLESKDMADVMFVVCGETISAHRLVLATQSPVFKAMLYGPMSEGTSTQIEIHDMKASVFKAMLHYIYADSLPSDTLLACEESCCSSPESNMAAEHLLEAADKYALDGLKMICENILCKGITINTVATTLILAHQHNCHELKDACLEFLKDPQTAHRVMLTDGFFQLMQTCPEVMMELRAKVNLSQSN